MKKLVIAMLWWVACWCEVNADDAVLAKLQDGNTVKLHGVGEYRDLNSAVYLGAVYLPLQAAEIQEGKSSKMEMRILASKLSGRKFTQLWLEEMLLNNSDKARVKYAGLIKEFGEIYKMDLQQGDRISFEFSATHNKTSFLLNEVVMQEIEGSAIYDILMRCWIGDLPKSEEFRAGIKNEVGFAEKKLALETKLEQLKFTEQRAHEVSAYSSHLKALQAQALQSELEAQAALERRRQAELEVAKQAEQLKRVEEERRAAEAKAQAEKAETQRAETLAAEKALAAEAARRESQVKKEQEAYRKKLTKWVGQRVIYPPKAAHDNIAGKLEVVFKSDREGNIVDLAVHTSSNNPQLDAATIEMLVVQVNSLPAMPEALKSEHFEFVMPLSFALEAEAKRRRNAAE